MIKYNCYNIVWLGDTPTYNYVKSVRFLPLANNWLKSDKPRAWIRHTTVRTISKNAAFHILEKSRNNEK